MYIDRLHLAGFRNFHEAVLDFVHPDAPGPRLGNVNLLLGDNGLGKTSVLKAIALTVLGPAVSDSGIFSYRLVRRTAENGWAHAALAARFALQASDGAEGKSLETQVRIQRKEQLEQLRWGGQDEELWAPIYRDDSPAFFLVGYGVNRRAERVDRYDFGARQSSSFARAQRLKGLFDESYSLAPLNAWLPKVEEQNPRQHRQIIQLVQAVLPPGPCTMTGEKEDGEFLFDWEGVKVPFPALSDGYRAFLSWISDLLFHLSRTCPADAALAEIPGVVLIDEIDLHLHPSWQMTVLPSLAGAFPKLQFIVTSHSPLVAGSLESANLLVLRPGEHQATEVRRLETSLQSMDADQILLTDYFGLATTRTDETAQQLKELTLKARSGDSEAALQLLQLLGNGS